MVAAQPGLRVKRVMSEQHEPALELMIASAAIVGQISMDIETVVMVSLGLSAISLIGLLIAVFTGVGLVSKEIDKRTLHAVLASFEVRDELVERSRREL